MTHPKLRPFTLDELRAYLVEIFPEYWKGGTSGLKTSRR